MAGGERGQGSNFVEAAFARLTKLCQALRQVSDPAHEERPLVSCGLVELYFASIARTTWLYTLAPNARREKRSSTCRRACRPSASATPGWSSFSMASAKAAGVGSHRIGLVCHISAGASG